MNSKMEPGDEQLSEALRSWKVTSPLPPRFNEGVWRRIAQEETQVQPGIWAQMVSRISGALMQPRVAWAYAAVLLALGATAGGFTAQMQSSRTEANLGSRYVQLIDPYSAAVAK